MKISIEKFIFLIQKQISQEQLKILCCLMNTFLQICIVCPDKSISEIPDVFRKISFSAENPSVLKYLIKNTAVVLVFPSPKMWICHSLEIKTAR